MTDLRRTPMYDQLLADAEQLAQDRGDGYVGVEHLIIAVFADPESVPAQELRDRMGGDPAELARRLGHFLSAPTPGPGQYRVRHLDGRATIHPVDDPGTVVASYDPGIRSAS